MEATDVKKKLVEALRRFDTVMVTTRAENGTIHARPMVVADIDESGEVCFVTSEHADKLEELEVDHRTVLTAQAKGLYVSLSGKLDVLHDRERIRALFKESWTPWFPGGKDDPSIVLLRLRPEIGEYWDERSMKGIRYAFEAARTMLNGERMSDAQGDPRQHAKVPM
jgi:general stress protein 26